MLSNRNIMQVTHTILNFLEAALKKGKKKPGEVRFNTLFNPTSPVYVLSTCNQYKQSISTVHSSLYQFFEICCMSYHLPLNLDWPHFKCSGATYGWHGSREWHPQSFLGLRRCWEIGAGLSLPHLSCRVTSHLLSSKSQRFLIFPCRCAFAHATPSCHPCPLHPLQSLRPTSSTRWAPLPRRELGSSLTPSIKPLLLHLPTTLLRPRC